MEIVDYSTWTSFVDLGPDEYRDANRPPPPKPDRVLPAALFFGGWAVLAVELLAFWSAPGHLYAAALLMAPALAIGWGLGGLRRPYRLVPRPETVVLIEVKRDANRRIRPPLRTSLQLTYIALGIALLTWTYFNSSDGPEYFFFIAGTSAAMAPLIWGLADKFDD
jgi:hypothetical protein